MGTHPASLLHAAHSLTLHTGNLMDWGRLKKKCAVGPGEELGDCIATILNEWSSKVTPELVQESPESLECAVSQAMETINPEEREEMKVSVKLFVLDSGLSSIRDAVGMVCSTLAVAQLDSVIIVPPPLEDGVILTLEHLQPYWRELESLVQDNKVVAIGTSDLDKPLLEQLYLWAQIKPSSNQVNLASCCIMPPDLTAFAKEFDIQLLTHSDSKEILSDESFQDVVRDSVQGSEAEAWSPSWVLRYSVIVKTRGIIKCKGYIVQAKRKAFH
ncbi:glutamate--cysteine ligase regulatory subunit [Hyperolius riggenbachi]|uniref:glutamate--cysteine ligase regulatory subunit n=1 Tax=Hyperolius riggenbachi TaxID=752182 RepID=UPI0035A28C16